MAKNNFQVDAMLSSSDVAKMLGYSGSSSFRRFYDAKHPFPRYKMGERRWGYKTSDVNNYLEQRKIEQVMY